jgi:hypothetical protein
VITGVQWVDRITSKVVTIMRTRSCSTDHAWKLGIAGSDTELLAKHLKFKRIQKVDIRQSGLRLFLIKITP